MNKTLLLAGASAFALVLGISTPAFAIDGARAEAVGFSSGNTATDDGSKRDNLLQNAFNPAAGIATAQQNNGSNNAINAATAVHADVTGGTALETGAHAKSWSGGRFQGNSSDHIGAHDPDRKNLILETMNGFMGAATVQQNNGDNNAINAATALDGVDGNTGDVTQTAAAETSTETNFGSFEVEGPKDEFTYFAVDEASTRENLIDPSFDGAAGVFTVQQNNGNGNALSAATAVLGITGNADSLSQAIAATGDTDKGYMQVNVLANHTTGTDTERYNRIENSFNGGFAGVATVQQNNGDNNAIGAATGVAGVGGNVGPLTQTTTAGGALELFSFNQSRDISGKRTNEISPSFNGASGILTVQQNNGDNNGLNAATSVAGVAGDTGTILQQAFNAFDGVYYGPGLMANRTFTDTSDRDNIIIDSFQEILGTATVQQNNGDANSISAGTGVIGVGGTSGDIVQNITAGDMFTGAHNAETQDLAVTRHNLIDPAFNDAMGIVTAQQNNGDANRMVALTAVVGNLGAGTVDQNISAMGAATRTNYFGYRDHYSHDVVRHNRIEDSFERLNGIATVQQNNGDGNSIVAATGVVASAGDTGATTQSVNAISFAGTDDIYDPRYGAIVDIRGERDNLIDPAFTDVEGILTVQQNNGSGNAITAATGVVANLGGAGDSSPEALAQGDVADASQAKHALPTTYDSRSDRTNTVTDWSFSNLRGIATVQQNNGGKNAISSAIAVAANSGDGKLDDVPVQKARAEGSVDNVRAEDRDADAGLRQNTLDDHVFDAAAGIVTVQQNNGSNNAINAAVSVRAETNSTVTSSPGEEEVTEQFAGATAAVLDATAYTDHQVLNGLASRHNLLTHAFTGGVDGIFTVQQNNGDNNAISASTALAADINTADDIDAVVDNEAKTVTTVGISIATDYFTRRVNTLNDGAFENAAGIVTVQQNNGDNNAIAAATGVVANIDTGFRFGKAVTADATGDAEVTGNTATSTSVSRGNVVDNAMNGIQGVVTVQQNNGDNNAIGAANDVVVSTEMPGFGPAASSATLGATVSGNTSTINAGSVLANTQTSSFAGASGLITVQQNNGNNNVLGSAITTVANGITFAFNN